MIELFLLALLKSAILPPGLFALTAVPALWYGLRGRPRRAAAWAFVTIVAVWFLTSWFGAGVISRGLETRAGPIAPAAELPDEVAAIVVLAGGSRGYAPEYGEATMNLLSLARLRYAAGLARRSGLPLLVTGGLGTEEKPPEAVLMARALERQFGLEATWVEGRSRNTRENARFSAEILRGEGIDEVVLVTHANHIPRARRAFAHYGITTFPAPTDFAWAPARYHHWTDFLPNATALVYARNGLYETLGLVWYRLRYGIGPIAPE